MFDANAPRTQMQAYIETLTFLFMPVEVLCRVQARSLMAPHFLMRERTHMR